MATKLMLCVFVMLSVVSASPTYTQVSKDNSSFKAKARRLEEAVEGFSVSAEFCASSGRCKPRPDIVPGESEILDCSFCNEEKDEVCVNEVCYCKIGFEKIGDTCTEVDYTCTSANCAGTCENNNTECKGACPPRFVKTGDGKRCFCGFGLEPSDNTCKCKNNQLLLPSFSCVDPSTNNCPTGYQNIDNECVKSRRRISLYEVFSARP